jgi:hypothetical protein
MVAHRAGCTPKETVTQNTRYRERQPPEAEHGNQSTLDNMEKEPVKIEKAWQDPKPSAPRSFEKQPGPFIQKRKGPDTSNRHF